MSAIAKDPEDFMSRTGKYLLLALLVVAGCGGREEARPPQDVAGKVLAVTATTGQVAELARNIGGPLVEVTALMGPGIDPHLYKASARDVERLRGADLILFNGLHLEAKMGEVLERIGRHRPALAVAETLDPARLISPDGFEGAHDPHVWFDVELWARTVPAVVKELSALAAQRTQIRDMAQLLSQKHFRITDPIINLIMLMISLPVLVCRDPKSMKSAVMISFALTGACFLTTFVCKILATEMIFDKVMPELWAWLPVFVFLPVALIELDSMKT